MRKIGISMVLVALISMAFTACNNSGATNSSATNTEKVAKQEVEIISDMSKFNDLINGDTPVLVDFYADWCGPCKMMVPILEQFSKEMDGSVRVIKIDVDKNRDAAMKYKIRSIPTMILFQNGEVKWQGVGVVQADQLKSVVENKL
jgi:thioredoxin 1